MCRARASAFAKATADKSGLAVGRGLQAPPQRMTTMSDTHEHGQRSWTRRTWLSTASAALVGSTIRDGTASASGAAQPGQAPAPPKGAPLPLTEFEPKSMLHVSETT